MTVEEKFARPNFRSHAEHTWKQALRWYAASHESENKDEPAIQTIEEMLENIWRCAHDGFHTTPDYVWFSGVADPVEGDNTDGTS